MSGYANSLVKDRKVTGVELSTGEIVESDCVIISYPAYHAINQLFDNGIFDDDFITKTNRLNKTTSVVEVHFALSKKLDERQVVFPVGEHYVSKGSIRAVELSFEILSGSTEANCEKLTFTDDICNEGYWEIHIFAGPKIPLPTSAIISAEEI